MSDTKRPVVGSVAWVDLTVDNAVAVRDFYRAVVGWVPADVDMPGYKDFSMNISSDGTPAAGICHARGSNADLPPQWLIYITVEDIDQSIARCVELGGSVIAGPRGMGSQGRYCVIRDPAGAVVALFTPPK
jgi:uncharacterized protein